MALKLQHYRFVTYNANSQNESFAALFLPKHQLILKFSAYVVLFNQGQTKASHKKQFRKKIFGTKDLAPRSRWLWSRLINQKRGLRGNKEQEVEVSWKDVEEDNGNLSRLK